MGCLQETGLRTLARSDQYTEHAQRFMRMGRQMGNVNIDYDIYLVSLKFLEEVFDLIKNADPPPSTKAEDWKLLHQEFRGGNFREVYENINLLRTYGRLYQQRGAIGNNEGSLFGRNFK